MAGLRENLVMFLFAYFYFGVHFFGKANIGLGTEVESVPECII